MVIFFHNASQSVLLLKNSESGQYFCFFFGKTDGFQWGSNWNFPKPLNKADFM